MSKILTDVICAWYLMVRDSVCAYIKSGIDAGKYLFQFFGSMPENSHCHYNKTRDIRSVIFGDEFGIS